MNELFLQNIPSIDVCISVEKFSHVLSLRAAHYQNKTVYQAAAIYSNAICIRRGAWFANSFFMQKGLRL